MKWLSKQRRRRLFEERKGKNSWGIYIDDHLERELCI